MKGWRTILWGALMTIAAGLIPYFAGIDWTTVVDPRLAAIIAGAVTIALRFVTTTPVGGAK